MTETALRAAENLKPLKNIIIGYKLGPGKSSATLGDTEIEIIEDEYNIYKQDTRKMLVTSVGDDVEEVKKGDVVVIRRQDGAPIQIEGMPFIKITENDVLGILEEV